MIKMLEYSINDDPWTFTIMKDEDYVKKHGNTVAMTVFDKFNVDFKQSDLDLRTVRHEVFHIHYKYCYTDSTNNLSLADQEEIFCELFGDRGDKIVNQAKEIYKKLKGKKK